MRISLSKFYILCFEVLLYLEPPENYYSGLYFQRGLRIYEKHYCISMLLSICSSLAECKVLWFNSIRRPTSKILETSQGLAV